MIRAATVIVLPRRADPPGSFSVLYSRRRLRGSAISPTAVNTLAAAIQTQEDYYPGSVAYRNNNPGNLVYAGQSGARRGADGFAVFPSYDLGLAALKNQIYLDASRGTDVTGRPIRNVQELISSWAPASDPRNNTPAYISSVVRQTGYAPDAPLSSLDSDVPTFTVDVYGSGIDSSSSAGASDYQPWMSAGSDGFDLATVAGRTVDLSAIGLSEAVPWWWIGAGLLAAVALSQRSRA